MACSQEYISRKAYTDGSNEQDIAMTLLLNATELFLFGYILVMDSTFLDSRLEQLKVRKSIQKINFKLKIFKRQVLFAKQPGILINMGQLGRIYEKSDIKWNKHRKK